MKNMKRNMKRKMSPLCFIWIFAASLFTNSSVLAQSCDIGSPNLFLPPEWTPYGGFGDSLAVSDTRIVIGAPNINGVNGTVSLFDALSYELVTQLVPNDGQAITFGESVAIDAERIVIGASMNSDSGLFFGAAYIFDALNGNQVLELLPEDGLIAARFGASAAIDGDRVVVGALEDIDSPPYPGAAFVFDTNTGEQLLKLIPENGMRGDFFGSSVSISESVVIVGAPGDSTNGKYSGAVYLFHALTGEQMAKILPLDGIPEDFFGAQVSTSDTKLIVAAVRDWQSIPLQRGSVYVFDLLTGEQQFKLLPSKGAEVGVFGASIALSDSIAAVGARSEGDGFVYLFDTDNGEQLAKLSYDVSPVPHLFGRTVAIHNGNLLVNSWHQKAFLYDIGFVQCPADFNADCSLDLFDASAFLNAYSEQESAGDFNADNTFNFLDISAFISAYAQGCP
jgi:FG-GAP repeat